jgi:hypothetical protein
MTFTHPPTWIDVFETPSEPALQGRGLPGRQTAAQAYIARASDNRSSLAEPVLIQVATQRSTEPYWTDGRSAKVLIRAYKASLSCVFALAIGPGVRADQTEPPL